jgi:phage gpG-like protein
MADMIKWKVEDHSNKFKSALPAKTGVILTKWGIKWQEISTGLVTKKGVVDTGLLRDTLGFKIDIAGKKVNVGSPQPYAAKHELGTHGMRARSFIVPAIREHGAAYKQIAVEQLKNL